MTKQEFITAVEAKPNFIKWAVEPKMVEAFGSYDTGETISDEDGKTSPVIEPAIEKWNGQALIATPDGKNVFQVWFIVDNEADEATWQNADQLDPEENAVAKKQAALEAYLASNFAGYFVNRADLENLWAEADVYEVSGQDLSKSTVLVFKKGSNPITHRVIV